MAGDSLAQAPIDVIDGILRAVVEQLAVAMRDVDTAVAEIDSAFQSIANEGHCRESQGSRDFTAHRDRIVVALQFHDLLEQRMRHACRSLSEVSELLASDDAELEVEHWHALAESLARASAIERDKETFAAVARKQDSDSSGVVAGESADDGRIELFR